MARLRHKAALAGAAALLGLCYARAESDTAGFSIASGGRISSLTRPTFIRLAKNKPEKAPAAFGGLNLGKARCLTAVALCRMAEKEREREREREREPGSAYAPTCSNIAV